MSAVWNFLTDWRSTVALLIAAPVVDFWIDVVRYNVQSLRKRSASE